MTEIDVIKHLAVYLSVEEYMYFITSDNILEDITYAISLIPSTFYNSPRYIALTWAEEKLKKVREEVYSLC